MNGNVTGPVAVKRALDQIDAVREAVRLHSGDLVLAMTAADVRRSAAQKKIAALMGVEGGHMLDNDLAVLRVFAALGVRYLTLTHSLNTTWADSSGDKPAHNGLTAFGKDVVREVNRLGMMVDISHASDKTFFDTIEVTKAPVIASHSSVRCPLGPLVAGRNRQPFSGARAPSRQTQRAGARRARRHRAGGAAWPATTGSRVANDREFSRVVSTVNATRFTETRKKAATTSSSFRCSYTC